MRPEQKRCSALMCGAIIKRDLLMCSPHWQKVPREIRDQVYSGLRAWTAGNSVTRYLLAVALAQNHVALLEGVEESLLNQIKETINQLEIKVGK